MAVSSGVQVYNLSPEEVARCGGFNVIARVPASTVAAVGTTNTTANVAVLDVAVGDVVLDCAYAITEAWTDSDASLNSITIITGDDGDTDRFMAVTTPQLAEDGTEIDYFASLAGVVATPTLPFAYTTANTIDTLFTVAGGANPTCAELTAGSVDIYFRIARLAKTSTGAQ